MTFALETIDLGRRYRRTWALQNCSLTIPEGRIAALIGPNGAGKTTLLNIAVGLLRPTEGTVRLFGASAADDPATLSKVSFVAQDRPLYRGFTVAEMLRFGAELNPRWDNDLALSRLQHLNIPLGQKVNKLSGGQQSQVALVLALAKRPELIVLDEPVAALDPLARREFLQILVDTTEEAGITVLLSSHMVGELERVCDYLVILNAARVQFAGELETFVDEHRLLVGQSAGPADVSKVGGVIHASRSGRQTSLIVKLNGHEYDPRWEVREPEFEEIVLAYMGRGAGEKEIAR
jgi:ABC-2 type transport system ATP-binding protein